MRGSFELFSLISLISIADSSASVAVSLSQRIVNRYSTSHIKEFQPLDREEGRLGAGNCVKCRFSAPKTDCIQTCQNSVAARDRPIPGG
jgi:hypothetical protein